MIRRRDVLAMLGGSAATWPLPAFAEPTAGLPLVARLALQTSDLSKDTDDFLRSGLKEGGFIEGKNVSLVTRYADGENERLASLAGELAALKPSVMVAGGNAAALAAFHGAPAVPLVFCGFGGDPVELGLAKSYARPGGTVTGITLNAGGGEQALIGKRIGLLKNIVPGLTRIGVIVGSDISDLVGFQNRTKATAGRLGIDAVFFPFRTIEDVVTAFASGVRAGVGAFYIDGGGLTMTNRAKVAEFAARAGKPTIGELLEQTRAGLLMSYAPDLADAYRRAGTYAAKILAGTKPGDIPIEQASKFTFVINLKTAQALGIIVPPPLMSLADELVE